MKKVIFLLLLTFTLPAVAHDGSFLSTEHLNDFGLFLIMLSVAFATLSLIMQTNLKSESLKQTTTTTTSEDPQIAKLSSLNSGLGQSNV